MRRWNPPPANRSTEAQGAGVSNGAKMVGPWMAAPLRPQRDTLDDTNSAGTPPRHTAGTNGARNEHGVLARRKYGLLAPPGTAVNPSDAGDQESRDGHDP